MLDIDETAHPVVHFIVGSCGIASPSERGSAPAKFTFRFVSLTTASPCPTVKENGSNSSIWCPRLEKDDIHIGFGIMGGWNQAQAHAQFVANVVDYGMNGKQRSSRQDLRKGLLKAAMCRWKTRFRHP